MAATPEAYDLLILVDATYSMNDYLASLQTSLPKIISISALTDSFERIGLLAYRDYCDDDLLNWSGWMNGSAKPTMGDVTANGLLSMARALYSSGGGDYPEATKTGLAKAYQVMREEATTIILLYTDAPPHTIANGSANGYTNHEQEQKALGKTGSYGGTGHLFMDWVHASRVLAQKEGNKRAQVFSVLEPSMRKSDGNYYTFLSTVTGGACFYLKNSSPNDISKVTVDILLAWMGVEKAGAAVTEIAAKLCKFKSTAGIEDVKKEATKESTKAGLTEELSVDSRVLKEFMPRRKTPVLDFAERYKTDLEYRKLVGDHLKKIIAQDVSAISLNPVFGSLWRAVCNDRENKDRNEILASFSAGIEGIRNEAEKLRMKNWLEESYDYSAEVQDGIESVKAEDRFPCVFLDPTLAFTRVTKAEDDDEGNRPITEFQRDELLEIGRSCDYRILRRLGRVLTRLTFVDKEDDLPAHIKNAREETVTRIPLALAKKEYGRKFWRILLHIIVPGTMLSARPAALLAAVTIKLGIQPLFEAAETEMRIWKGRWNDLEIPETWNVTCLSLLLDADAAYIARKKSDDKDAEVTGLLRESDRELFDRLASYKMLELNLKTSLTANVSWKPEKTVLPLGPVVVCRSCQYPRSVTLMAAKGRCGMCAFEPFPSDEERHRAIHAQVTKDDNQETNATWVECSTTTCRAQYVVYRAQDLNVRAKCHYCRMQTRLLESRRSNNPAPWIECTTCLSRVIFPHEYQAPGGEKDFKCVGCSIGRKTVVDIETSAVQLSKENGTAWLLENRDGKLKEPLSGMSLFKQITAAGVDHFIDKVHLFPKVKKAQLALRGKPVQNAADLVAQLNNWVIGRRTESGTCSLCFSNSRKDALQPSCGRRGCDQRICKDCLSSWYGLNGPGQIINTAALSCAFCRRNPSAKTLHNYGMGIHAVGDLRDAVVNRGEWVYAWCTDCSHAKQYLERVCAAGAPDTLTDWACGACIQVREEHAAEEARERQLELERLRRELRREEYEIRFAAEMAAMDLAHINSRKPPLITRKCPGCRVVTERSDGCGHLKCTQCGCHWCWFCGERKDASSIYSHMTEAHGGYFDGEIVVREGECVEGCREGMCECEERYEMRR